MPEINSSPRIRFGEQLRQYRNLSKTDKGRLLSLEKFSEALRTGKYAGYLISVQRLNNWEFGKQAIPHDERNLLMDVLSILVKHGGLPKARETINHFLALGEYRSLNDSEWQEIAQVEVLFSDLRGFAQPYHPHNEAATETPIVSQDKLAGVIPNRSEPTQTLQWLKSVQSAVQNLWSGKSFRPFQAHFLVHGAFIGLAVYWFASRLLPPLTLHYPILDNWQVLEYALNSLTTALFVLIALLVMQTPGVEQPANWFDRFSYYGYLLQGTWLGIAIGWFVSLLLMLWWDTTSVSFAFWIRILYALPAVYMAVYAGVHVPQNILKGYQAWNWRAGAIFWVVGLVPTAWVIFVRYFPEFWLSENYRRIVLVASLLLLGLMVLLEWRGKKLNFRAWVWVALPATIATPYVLLTEDLLFALAVIALWAGLTIWLYREQLVINVGALLIFFVWMLAIRALSSYNETIGRAMLLLSAGSLWIFQPFVKKYALIPASFAWIIAFICIAVVLGFYSPLPKTAIALVFSASVAIRLWRDFFAPPSPP